MIQNDKNILTYYAILRNLYYLLRIGYQSRYLNQRQVVFNTRKMSIYNTSIEAVGLFFAAA